LLGSGACSRDIRRDIRRDILPLKRQKTRPA
jgi:hypothetical protein